jgi:hypothetical protein
MERAQVAAYGQLHDEIDSSSSNEEDDDEEILELQGGR